MSTADGRFTIVYNGEVTNYQELRAELVAAGRRFRSGSDTEVLLEAWAAWGPAALERLEGMFAFALFDREAASVTLARDPFGIKPLFYVLLPTGAVFASEIPALLEFGGISRRANPARLWDYLVRSNTDHGSETMLADVRQVPPAHRLTVSLAAPSSAEPERYWRAENGERRTIPFGEAATELRGLLEGSVRRHLRSDVPVGFALSGGVDSSAMLALARGALGPAAELHAFGYVSDDPALSEESYQVIAAQSAHATLHPVRFTANDLERELDTLMQVQGEPFASPTIYGQYRIFRAAREAGMKVMVGGQGADEIFAGYQRYAPARVVSLLREHAYWSAGKFARAAGRRWQMRGRSILRSALGLSVPRRWQESLRVARRRHRRLGWVAEEWFLERGIGPTPVWMPRGREALKELLLHTIEDVHLQALMRYEDRNAMAFSIENRVPFLTPALARFAFAMPESYLISPEGVPKALLRAAMRGIVPDPILDRRDKIGFAVPVAGLLASSAPWVERQLKALRGMPMVRPDQIQRHWDAVRIGRSIPDAFLVWRWLGLTRWIEQFNIRCD